MIPDEKLAEAFQAAQDTLPKGMRAILIVLDPQAKNLDEACCTSDLGELRTLFVLASILRQAGTPGGAILPVKNN